MKKLKFLSLFIIMAMLAGCAAQTADNSATAKLSGTQTVQTGTASANSTSTSEMQNTPTQGQASSDATAAIKTSPAGVSGTQTSGDDSEGENISKLENGPLNRTVVQIGDWVYFLHVYAMDIAETLRINLTTNRMETVNDDNMYNMTYGDGWIYYVHYGSAYKNDDVNILDLDDIRISRIRPDGTEKGADTKLSYDIDNNFVYDDYLYALVFAPFSQEDNDNMPIRMKLNEDGSIGEPEALFEDTDIRAYTMTQYNGWIYFTRSNNYSGSLNIAEEDYGLYRCKPDGTGLEKVSGQVKYTFFIADDWIYYCERDDAESEENALYKMRIDGSDNTLIYGDIHNQNIYLNYMGGWIYFKNADEQGDLPELHRIRTDGTGLQKIDTGDYLFTGEIIGNYIILYSKNDELCVMEMDGSDIETIGPSRYYIIE